MPKTKKAVLIAEVGSGNVFADLGLPNAGELNTKLRLCFVINKIVAERKLTQAEAARILGINQPKISALKSYKLEGFSVERLMHFAIALEHDVVIEIRPRAAKGAARVMVVEESWIAKRRPPSQNRINSALALLNRKGTLPPAPGDEIPETYKAWEREQSRKPRRKAS